MYIFKIKSLEIHFTPTIIKDVKDNIELKLPNFYISNCHKQGITISLQIQIGTYIEKGLYNYENYTYASWQISFDFP